LFPSFLVHRFFVSPAGGAVQPEALEPREAESRREDDASHIVSV